MTEVVAVGREEVVIAGGEEVGIDDIGGGGGVEWVVANGDVVVVIGTNGWQAWGVSEKRIWQEVLGVGFVEWDVEVEYSPRMEG